MRRLNFLKQKGQVTNSRIKCSSASRFVNTKGFLELFSLHGRDLNSTSKKEGMTHVKEGYFSVITLDNGGEFKKFFVALRYLTHPLFLKLLEAAEQEFGFNQKGVLVIPCEANELQRILSI